MTRTTAKILASTLVLAASCARPSSHPREKTDGFCFEAEGLRKARCHTELATCLRRESLLRDQSPHVVIRSECQFRPKGLQVEGLAGATAKESSVP